jgi:hypothetical protein
MKNQIKKIIETIILKKYSEVISVDEVEDMSELAGLETLLNNYIVNMTTSECLSSKQMMYIDTEIKDLLTMLGLEGSPFSFRKPHIKSFFDCGNGDGYRFSGHYAYEH